MKQNNQLDKIPILSFFSGGGFLDMGFEKAGFDIIFSNEIDEDFAHFYKEGLSSWSKTEKEITKVCDFDRLNLEDLYRIINNNNRFGVIGGPPCQDFSLRGNKNGFKGIRGTLTYKFYDFIKKLKPTFFLMENVPGLILLKNVKHKFDEILDLMSQDYLISKQKLNSLHFGVPQNRERLFVFGLNKEYLNYVSTSSFDNNWFKWPDIKYPDVEKKYNWGEPIIKKNRKVTLPKPPSKFCVERILVSKNDMTKIPNANEFFNLRDPLKISKIEEGDTYRQSFKRLHREKYSPTACYGNNEVHLHPVQNRRLSVRETLRIQGIPDSYILATKGKLSKKFKMIGNGVPYPLAYEVANSIKNFFIDIDKKKTNGYLVKGET